MNRVTLLIIFSGVLLNAAAQLILKAGTTSLGTLFPTNSRLLPEVFRILLHPFILGGLVCYAMSFILWIAALSKAPVSVAYPMLSIGYIVNAIAAYYLFGEDLTTQKLIGVATIILGVVLVVES